MKTLVIKGHPTRGKEVIETLEMLGGKNEGGLNGKSRGFYFIGCNNNIDIISLSQTNFMIFDLEEFLEKYPYKVGDMVQYKGPTSCRSIYRIEKMLWKNNQINYVVYNPWQEYDKCIITAEYLQPYEEENYTEIYTDNAINDDSKTDIIINGENLIAPNGYTIENVTRNNNRLIVEYIKNKPQYPKTYKECCDVLGIGTMDNDAQGYKADDIIRFQELLIARDTYWKIAGEELGLSEPWKPNFGENFIYAISAFYGTIQKTMVTGGRGILLFPTEEMRDAFYENFKNLIEKCKEFL